MFSHKLIIGATQSKTKIHLPRFNLIFSSETAEYEWFLSTVVSRQIDTLTVQEGGVISLGRVNLIG